MMVLSADVMIPTIDIEVAYAADEGANLENVSKGLGVMRQ